ncbi:valacyclovir hydrolase [Achlya hypogyna]|uniref:Valacyclovir hydrolase n=1 Tax=Achlya hypogyna TaxID=1202772 RepID=A0A1V9YFL1_ACHHY|nr:valacyclovir hydrolase [Achlya hypogyna]
MMLLRRSMCRTAGARTFASLVSMNVNGNDCHATVERATEGKKVLLCLPGALGTGATDFGPQLDAFKNDYSVVAFHPDPAHNASVDLLSKNAHDAAALMKGLGYEKYSVLGWSDGANAAVILAAEYPAHMERLVLMGGNAFISDEDIELYNAIADVKTWGATQRDNLAQVHGGLDKLQERWTEWIATMNTINDSGGDICTSYLPDVKCKTLVLHGELDSLVPGYQGEYLSERILHSKLQVVPGAKHNLHLSSSTADAVNAIIRSFLVEPDDKETHSREFAAMPPKDPKAKKDPAVPVYHSGPRC